jgi:hypothetical protein
MLLSWQDLSLVRNSTTIVLKAASNFLLSLFIIVTKLEKELNLLSSQM